MLVQAIRSHPTPLQIYEKRLLEEGVVSKEEMSSITDNVQSTLSSEFDGAKVTSGSPLLAQDIISGVSTCSDCCMAQMHEW